MTSSLCATECPAGPGAVQTDDRSRRVRSGDGTRDDGAIGNMIVTSEYLNPASLVLHKVRVNFTKTQELPWLVQG